MKYNNIITHTSNGKPIARDKKKDFIQNYRPEEAYLCFKSAGQYGLIIYNILKWKMGMDKSRFGSEKDSYVVSNKETRRWMTRQRKNEAIEDLAEAGLLVIVEAAPGKNKKVRLRF
jgi:hypothetical protein